MIIVEGIDGTGKTTVAKALEKMGYTFHHLTYDEKSEEGYLNLLNLNPSTLVLDRSFISELVYGPILRNYSRIDNRQTINIIGKYYDSGLKIIYLKSSKNVLLMRRKSDSEDTQMLQMYYEQLNQKYDDIMNELSEYIPILEIDTSSTTPEEVANLVRKFIGIKTY